MRQKRRLKLGLSPARWLAVLALVLVSSIGLAACGGASDEEIAQAERQGAAKERQRQRLNELEKELRRGLKDLKNGDGRKDVPAPNPPSTSAPAPAPSSEGNCGGTLSVNSVTTCEFAENVRAAYESELGSGSGTVSAYSPARGIYYDMYCTAGPPHECTGGDEAAVFFP